MVFKLADLARRFNGQIRGDPDVEIHGVAPDSNGIRGLNRVATCAKQRRGFSAMKALPVHLSALFAVRITAPADVLDSAA